MAANMSSDMPLVSAGPAAGGGAVAGVTDGHEPCSASPRDAAPSAVSQTVTEETTSADREASSSASGQKLSRRAMKRLIRNKQREAAKEGRTAKRRRKEETRELNFTESSLSEAEYYFEHGLRKVYPYYFTFSTYAKGRWIGQTILDVFITEFKAYDEATYRAAIISGSVTVNNNKVNVDYVFKESDYIENTVHRHELGVTGMPIKIVLETDTVLVVDKPGSIPVHPCGRYRYNSLTYILAKDYGYRNLRTIYRLDRLTSGLLIFCKTEAQTLMMQDHIKNRKVEKCYVARVVGTFPSEPQVCLEPIDILSHKIGLFKVGPNGKEARTSFELLHTDGNTSVVLCKPHTGRTHQIRVHLQFLGHPIVNDPIYNTPVWGPNCGKGGDYGKDEAQLVEDLLKHHNSEKFNDDEVANLRDIDASQETPVERPSDTSTETNLVKEASSQPSNSNAENSSSHLDIPTCKNLTDDVAVTADRSGCRVGEVLEEEPTQTRPIKQPSFDSSKLTVDPGCLVCRKKYKDPGPEDLVMFLHALSYKGPGWEFSTTMPNWAQEDRQAGSGEVKVQAGSGEVTVSST